MTERWHVVQVVCSHSTEAAALDCAEQFRDSTTDEIRVEMA